MPQMWILVPVLAMIGAWFLYQGLRPGSHREAPGVTDRITHFAHVLMAVTMIAMLWPM
ncbi:hypothetical protein OHA18_42445 [Kribbella sp. NBC_00709]|uniref:hypothetical protein n=1 Tax=Kribbella sp. NBC_00709 TaxID=2975972 RepID=UPI002E2C01D0|nr:hypothetical protein [Kribbella sp. NBC_00709]